MDEPAPHRVVEVMPVGIPVAASSALAQSSSASILNPLSLMTLSWTIGGQISSDRRPWRRFPCPASCS